MKRIYFRNSYLIGFCSIFIHYQSFKTAIWLRGWLLYVNTILHILLWIHVEIVKWWNDIEFCHLKCCWNELYDSGEYRITWMCDWLCWYAVIVSRYLFDLLVEIECIVIMDSFKFILFLVMEVWWLDTEFLSFNIDKPFSVWKDQKGYSVLSVSSFNTFHKNDRNYCISIILLNSNLLYWLHTILILKLIINIPVDITNQYQSSSTIHVDRTFIIRVISDTIKCSPFQDSHFLTVFDAR